MPTTWSTGRRLHDESWRALRRRRRRSSTSIVTDDHEVRLQTLQTALERAEQQFRAAGAAGYDSRALNLFHGLS